jgi:hypothetical protein
MVDRNEWNELEAQARAIFRKMNGDLPPDEAQQQESAAVGYVKALYAGFRKHRLRVH